MIRVTVLVRKGDQTVTRMAPSSAAKSTKKESDGDSKSREQSYGGINTNNLEFGGWVGALSLMIWSHYILYYFW